MAYLELDDDYKPAEPDYIVWITQLPNKLWKIQTHDYTKWDIHSPHTAKEVSIRFANFEGKHNGKRAQVKVRLLSGEVRVVWTYGVDEYPEPTENTLGEYGRH